MLFDSFTLVEQAKPNPPVYYLPEESLAKVIGENSAGDWKLEVLDNRAGAANPPPKLVSWQLSLTLETTVPFAIPLCRAGDHSVNPNDIRYFVVDVRLGWLRHQPPVQCQRQRQPALQPFSLPGTNVTDVTLMGPNKGGTRTLTTNGAPCSPASATSWAQNPGRQPGQLHPRSGFQHHHAEQRRAVDQQPAARSRPATTSLPRPTPWPRL